MILGDDGEEVNTFYDFHAKKVRIRNRSVTAGGARTFLSAAASECLPFAATLALYTLLLIGMSALRPVSLTHYPGNWLFASLWLRVCSRMPYAEGV